LKNYELAGTTIALEEVYRKVMNLQGLKLALEAVY
jgi:hypothetical protein